MAAAIVLADAGWRVTVLERNEDPGGAVRSGEVTLPGFTHDLMATNLNLFAGSPFFARFGARLEHNGLVLAHSDRPFCSVFPGDGYVGVSTDLSMTLDSIASVNERDAEAFDGLYSHYERVAPHLFPLLGVSLPSARAVRLLWKSRRALGKDWPFELTRLVTQSPRHFVSEFFESAEIQSLVAVWGMHLDFAPDLPGGALFPFLETMASQANGMVIAQNGAASMINAMVALLEDLGGEVVCDTPVDGVIVEDGRARGVVANGTTWSADRVIANITPGVLFGSLVEPAEIPARFMEKVGGFRYGPGTLMVHVALDGPVPWSRGEAGRHMYVHIGPYLDDMNLAYQQATAGLLPERPTLVVGQPSVVDPTRAPEGKHVLWVQARMMPGSIRGDAAGELTGSDWAGLKEAMADRVMGQIEAHAPGLGALVLGRHVLSPTDLETMNPNLVGGDSLGGSHHPSQHYFMRPFPGWSRYRTPIDGLYMCGSGTWPGAGLGAGSGFLLGTMLSSSRR